MPYHQSGGIRYLTFESLHEQGVVHAAFTRNGGVSPDPWHSLNMGALVGDSSERVIENRRRAFHAVGRDPASMYDVWQVHGNEVVCADKPRPVDMLHRKADAILTDQPSVTLLMRFADCVPILLFDPRSCVVGLAHAGWLGTVRRTAESAVQAMQRQYGSRAEDIQAVIGPSICADHYEVGWDVITQVCRAFGEEAELVLSNIPGDEVGKAQFDLWKANRLVLEKAGVQQIEVSGICTACQPEDWYSHRGENGKTGRFGVLIGLHG